ncbi:protein TIFY 6B-like isoform X5 [Olea europaea var. sylvestris]|uniref:protein TIFY 6B-like isoform X5 n=1 Tax=Olea europaea var. sylvestris TaxID=158386 RepID=UPI000C1D46BD|nr:protein TIFY 6B-like isoform X5 [Olea europaea var. sylvestris]XP_022882051.1 protein TIFY 6B-like isoform X5 [Olea europaea var. sylvestris]
MERVRMGLSSKDSVAVIKEEIVQDCKDSGFTNSSGVQLLLSNEETTLPHFASSKSEQHQTLSEMKSDPLASPGVVAKSAADLFDASQKQRSGNIQFEDATKKQQFLCEIPPTASVFGTTKQWFHSKASAAPAQLTIFYAGKVNVFDEISPEKAQAIILLAGNGCVSSNMAQPRLSVDTLTSKVAAADGALVNQSMNVTRCSVLSSPVSVSSHPIDQSRSTPASNNEDVKVSNSLGFSANIVSEAEPPRRVTSLGSIAATEIISSAAPQARKASLARFFEKRKERAMNSAPYNLCKKVADADRATPESGDFGYSATSDVPGSISVSTFKESSTEI